MSETFQSYDRIRAKLRYLNVSPNPARAARYFYQCFVSKEVQFCADTAYRAKVCDQAVPFIAWLHTLESHGLVDVHWINPHRYSRIYEGKALHEEFNVERSRVKEMATADDVRGISDRLARMERGYERVAKVLQIPCDPPDYIEFFRALSEKEEVPF